MGRRIGSRVLGSPSHCMRPSVPRLCFLQTHTHTLTDRELSKKGETDLDKASVDASGPPIYLHDFRSRSRALPLRPLSPRNVHLISRPSRGPSTSRLKGKEGEIRRTRPFKRDTPGSGQLARLPIN